MPSTTARRGYRACCGSAVSLISQSPQASPPHRSFLSYVRPRPSSPSLPLTTPLRRRRHRHRYRSRPSPLSLTLCRRSFSEPPAISPCLRRDRACFSKYRACGHEARQCMLIGADCVAGARLYLVDMATQVRRYVHRRVGALASAERPSPFPFPVRMRTRVFVFAFAFALAASSSRLFSLASRSRRCTTTGGGTR